VADAWKRTRRWLDAPNVWCPEPTERHRTLLEQFLRGVTASSRAVADADLAALAIEHRLLLCSTDSDFARFDGLRWENPSSRRREARPAVAASRGCRLRSSESIVDKEVLTV